MKKIYLLAVSLFLSGCVNFTSDNSKVLLQDGIKGNKQQSVLLNMQVFSTYEGVSDASKASFMKMDFLSQLQSSFYKSGAFGEVSTNVYLPRYSVDVVIRNDYTECKWCNYTTYATLFLIPSWDNDKYVYDVRITDLKTNKCATFTYFEDKVEVRELLFVLAMPFTYDNVYEMHQNVFDRIVFETNKLAYGF
ncbi:MAG: hypothetical protein PHE89_07050 [Alphaproteobacteria bacterium]|nr:hypothetical protein [Alphaproteobacteria bacterium]